MGQPRLHILNYTVIDSARYRVTAPRFLKLLYYAFRKDRSPANWNVLDKENGDCFHLTEYEQNCLNFLGEVLGEYQNQFSPSESKKLYVKQSENWFDFFMHCVRRNRRDTDFIVEFCESKFFSSEESRVKIVWQALNEPEASRDFIEAWQTVGSYSPQDADNRPKP